MHAAAVAGGSVVGSDVFGAQDAFAQRPDGPNILLVIVDSLRADAVYEDWVRTPNIAALARQGVSFTHVFPEAMPTVPARNSLLSGRRRFPFRGWHDRKGLISAPGWEPLDHVDSSLLAVLRRAGWWTSYVTDNPFLGFSKNYEPLRNSAHRFVRTGGQVGGGNEISSVPDHVLEPLAPPVEPERAHAGAHRALPRQQPHLGELGQLLRRARLPQRPRGARDRGARASARSRSWSTPTSRTSPGPRPTASSVTTRTAAGAAPSPRCRPTAAPRTGSARASAGA